MRHLRAVQPAGSSYADVVRLALHALAAGLFLTVSLRYVALGGMPGGIDADFYTATDSTALAMLGSQMQFAGWLPGLVVTGVVAHASLRRRLFARWVGALLALLTLASAGATLALGLPYSSGLIVPVCLTVLSAALLPQRRPR